MPPAYIEAVYNPLLLLVRENEIVTDEIAARIEALVSEGMSAPEG